MQMKGACARWGAPLPLLGPDRAAPDLSGAVRHVVNAVLPLRRTQQSSLVCGPPGIRFYAGAPLVASNGHRVGALCVSSPLAPCCLGCGPARARACPVPACPAAASPWPACALMWQVRSRPAAPPIRQGASGHHVQPVGADRAPAGGQLGTPVSEEVRRPCSLGACLIPDYVTAAMIQASLWARRHSRTLLRAMSCYTEPCMFVDVSAPRWSILHINEAVIEQTGLLRWLSRASASQHASSPGLQK